MFLRSPHLLVMTSSYLGTKFTKNHRKRDIFCGTTGLSMQKRARTFSLFSPHDIDDEIFVL